ncbi:hypothetical protein GCM10009716_39730 [Streptomyces sodiiphilus]|uniref:Uncharacterized protein n=1 Tax=Streptomyces sodiiphilus TaxID=226217 RepID=A0ABN2PQ46_9ACTN
MRSRMKPRKIRAAVSFVTAERSTASSGSRVAGFSQMPKKKRVTRSPRSAVPSSGTSAMPRTAGSPAGATAAANTSSLVPK